MKVNRSIDKYNTLLVVKGHKQREDHDYFDTYSQVTRINLNRVILAIATLRNLKVYQMDVKITFLNGDLDKEIYMKKPEGFSVPGQEKSLQNWYIHHIRRVLEDYILPFSLPFLVHKDTYKKLSKTSSRYPKIFLVLEVCCNFPTRSFFKNSGIFGWEANSHISVI